MRIFKGFDNLSGIKRPVVTIGSFDGVHSGHREILSLVTHEASERDGESVVITFEPHPRLLLESDSSLRLLSSLDEKLSLLEQAGIDNVIIACFDKAFSLLSAEQFIKYLLVDKLHIDTLMVGYNHRLGHGKGGDAGKLPMLAEKYGFRLVRMQAHYVDGAKVSSTVVRNLIEKGDMISVAHYLRRPYSISGIIDSGGTFLPGEPRKALPKTGRHSVRLSIAGESEQAGEAEINDKGAIILYGFRNIGTCKTANVIFM